MGSKHKYICNKCGYSVLASGKQDYGMIVKTDTYICHDCKEVVDVDVEYWTDRKPKKSTIGECPICESKKHLVKWDNQTRPCPRCDGTLEKIYEDYMMWD